MEKDEILYFKEIAEHDKVRKTIVLHRLKHNEILSIHKTNLSLDGEHCFYRIDKIETQPILDNCKKHINSNKKEFEAIKKEAIELLNS